MRRLSCALYKDHPKGVQSKTWNLVLLWSLAALLALVPNASAQELRAEEVLRLLARGPAK